MNKRTSEQASGRTPAQGLGSIALTLALLLNAGCTPDQLSEPLSTLANDFARQLAAFCLL